MSDPKTPPPTHEQSLEDPKREGSGRSYGGKEEDTDEPSHGPIPSWVTLRPLVRAVVAKTLHLGLQTPDVEEVTQEALTAIAGSMGSHRGTDAVSQRAFAAAIARNVARDAIAARIRTRKQDPLEGTENKLEGANVERALEARSSLRHLEARIQKLPEGQRLAFVGFYLHDKSYEALALEFAVPVGTVATWIFRAKITLQEGLNEERTR